MPIIFSNIPDLVAAESTRHGGVSPAPYSSLNLGKNTGDAPANVATNKQIFARQAGFDTTQLVWSKQVHGKAVLVATKAGGYEGYDALISNQRGLMLSVTVADCTPVLVYDQEKQVWAAIHAGWRGTAAGIVHDTLLLMEQTFGTQGANCLAYVGTCIDGCDYEVGAEVAQQFEADFLHIEPKSGRYLLDLKKANTAQLQNFGIPLAQIEVSAFSTVANNADYFSHRLEKGTTGRMMAVIGLRT